MAPPAPLHPPGLRYVDLDEITAPRVREWRAERLRTTGAKTTVAKAYRLLKGILETAVDDDLISRNPCRIKGAGKESAAERRIAPVAQVDALADAIGIRWRLTLSAQGGEAAPRLVRREGARGPRLRRGEGRTPSGVLLRSEVAPRPHGRWPPGQLLLLRPPSHLGTPCGCGARPAHRSRQQRTPGPMTWGFHMERVTRIELALSAWEADVLPLNYTRVRRPPGRSERIRRRCPIAWSLYLITGPRR